MNDDRIREEAKEFAKLARSAPPAAGEPAERIHPAASVILLREKGGGEIEVLLARRSQNVRFMPGAWVFPGGRLDDEDHGGAAESIASFQTCAVREANEEVGIKLQDAGALVWFSHWITPQGLPHRFDTRFFLAAAPDGAVPEPDGHEVDEARWLTPSAAIAANSADEMTIFFPTVKQLERLVGVATIADAITAAETTPITPVEPRVFVEDGTPRIVLPGDDGYE